MPRLRAADDLADFSTFSALRSPPRRCPKVMVFALEGNPTFACAVCWGLAGIVHSNSGKGPISFGAGTMIGILLVTSMIAFCGRTRNEPPPDPAEPLGMSSTKTLESEAGADGSESELTPLTGGAAKRVGAAPKGLATDTALSDPGGWDFVRDPANIFGGEAGRRVPPLIALSQLCSHAGCAPQNALRRPNPWSFKASEFSLSCVHKSSALLRPFHEINAGASLSLRSM